MNKKYLPTALILYMNYFIHGIGCSILSQQVVKEQLIVQWGVEDVMLVTSIAAALGLGRLISLPFAGPLSDKLGRRLSVLIGVASYIIFFVGIAFSPNMQIAYVAAVLGGIANSFLDTATYPAVAEIINKYTGIATMGIKFFISIAQLLMPFFLGCVVGTKMSYLMLPLVAGASIAGIPSETVSIMQTYYSEGTMAVLVITSILITKFKQVRFLVIYPAISVIMLVLVYIMKSPVICYVGAFVIGYAAAGGVLQMATATVNDLFPKIKGTITSLVMIASSLCNYTILSAASRTTATGVIMMNIVITVIGVVLAVFVNARYGTLLKNAKSAK